NLMQNRRLDKQQNWPLKSNQNGFLKRLMTLQHRLFAQFIK
ncbi:MAG: hypothetical protein ACI9VT_002133, partial [Psychroserpens sp.]